MTPFVPLFLSPPFPSILDKYYNYYNYLFFFCVLAFRLLLFRTLLRTTSLALFFSVSSTSVLSLPLIYLCPRCLLLSVYMRAPSDPFWHLCYHLPFLHFRYLLFFSFLGYRLLSIIHTPVPKLTNDHSSSILFFIFFFVLLFSFVPPFSSVLSLSESFKCVSSYFCPYLA